MSRKIDLFAFRGDDSDDGDEEPVMPKVELDALKSKTFSYGNTKKTKKDLEREAAEKKRLEDEKATQLALEEFAQSFEGHHHGPSMAHRPGPGRGRGQAFVRAGDTTVYNPITHAALANARGSASFDRPAPPSAMTRRSPSPPPAPRQKGKRAMDSFLKEIKQNQEARVARLGHLAQREGSSVTALAAHEGYGGGRGPVESTNLIILNLPDDVTEDSLGRLFAKSGDVGTVKVMWPRGDDDFHGPGARRQKPGLTGFVCFMNRKGAEAALREFDGYDWLGSSLRVNWSKPVPIPRIAAFEHASHAESSRHRERSRSQSPSGARRRRTSPSGNQQFKQFYVDQVPLEHQQFMETVANRIRTHGVGFGEMLRTREVDNPRFAFMFDDKLPAYHVFRYLQDQQYRFPEPPRNTFQDDGYASVYSTDSGEESEMGRTDKTRIGKLALKRFEALLRSLSGKRSEIARAMEFAVKHAEAADEVANLICESLMIDDTPIPRKIARLHLVSDILHNSASPIPNVWRYRHAFEKRLLKVFSHLADVHDRLLEQVSSIAAAVFLQQVDAVLSIWERWIVFTADVHADLRRLIHREVTLDELENPQVEAAPEPEPETVSKSAGFKSSFKTIGSVATAAVPTPSFAASAASPDDLDGEEMDDVDGEPMGEDDVDGESMDMDEDMDGEPLEG